MAQSLKIIKKTALSWWFEVDSNGELRTISDFEVNIGNSMNIVEIDGSKIFVNGIANIEVKDETTTPNTTFNFIDPFLLEQKLRDLDFVPYRGQVPTSGGSQNLEQTLANGNTANNSISLNDTINQPTVISTTGLSSGIFNLDQLNGFNFETIGRNYVKGRFDTQGILIKTSTINSGEAQYKNDNVTANAIFQAPNTIAGEFVMPISVNGVLAGTDGNITIDAVGTVSVFTRDILSDGSATVTLATNEKLQMLFINQAPQYKSTWDQTGDVLTITPTPEVGSMLTITGISN